VCQPQRSESGEGGGDVSLEGQPSKVLRQARVIAGDDCGLGC
jgi:hypothetical protein